MTVAPLPSFGNPPIDEVSCSLQFGAALRLRLIDLASLAEQFTDRYPTIEDHPPLAPIPRGDVQFTFQVGTEFDLPRLLFIDPTSTHLVQLQRDRIGVNWRRAGTGAAYPRYDQSVRPALIEACERLRAGLADLGLEFPEIEAIEVTYVNPIPVDETVDVSSILSCWSGSFGPELAQSPLGVGIQLSFEMANLDGRLFVEVGTATRNDDGSSVLLVNLVVRASVTGSLESALVGVDAARVAIVNTFASLTTTQMHEKWERIT